MKIVCPNNKNHHVFTQRGEHIKIIQIYDGNFAGVIDDGEDNFERNAVHECVYCKERAVTVEEND